MKVFTNRAWLHLLDKTYEYFHPDISCWLGSSLYDILLFLRIFFFVLQVSTEIMNGSQYDVVSFEFVSVTDDNGNSQLEIDVSVAMNVAT